MKKTLSIGIVAGIVMLLIGYIAGSYFAIKLGGDKSLSFGSGMQKLSNDTDTFSYYYGFNVGQYVNKDLEQLKMKENFPSKLFLNGISTGISGEGNEIDQNAMQVFMQGFFAKKQAEMQIESD